MVAISFKLLGPAAGLLLFTQLAQAAVFTPWPKQYDIFCGPKPDPSQIKINAICMDAQWDIRNHIKENSPELAGILAQDNPVSQDKPSRFAVLVGQLGESVSFSTAQHKVTLQGAANNNRRCVVYSIEGPGGSSGVFCIGEPHVQLP